MTKSSTVLSCKEDPQKFTFLTVYTPQNNNSSWWRNSIETKIGHAPLILINTNQPIEFGDTLFQDNVGYQLVNLSRVSDIRSKHFGHLLFVLFH